MAKVLTTILAIENDQGTTILAIENGQGTTILAIEKMVNYQQGFKGSRVGYPLLNNKV
jgi:hypothetical protein